MDEDVSLEQPEANNYQFSSPSGSSITGVTKADAAAVDFAIAKSTADLMGSFLEIVKNLGALQ